MIFRMGIFHNKKSNTTLGFPRSVNLIQVVDNWGELRVVVANHVGTLLNADSAVYRVTQEAFFTELSSLVKGFSHR
jgi:hypothetical protein